MKTLKQELLIIQDNLTSSDVIGHDPIVAFNEAIHQAQLRTKTNLLHLLISLDDAKLFPRVQPNAKPEYFCTRPLFIERLQKALAFCESTL
jgi:hypothetical protein